MGTFLIATDAYFDGLTHHSGGPYQIRINDGLIEDVVQGIPDTVESPADAIYSHFVMPGLVEGHCHLFLDGGELDFQKRKSYLSSPFEEMLNLARANANSKGGVASGEWVSFYPLSDYYELNGDPDIDHPEDEYRIYLAKTAYPVDLVSATFTNENGYTSNTTIKYDMYGRANSGSPPSSPDAHLTSGQIVVASAGQQRTVVISPVTGKARVQ